MTLEFEREMPNILKFDETRLRQILVNILGNAIKFTHEGEINIKVNYLKHSPAECDIIIAIADTGIGVPDSEKERIFNVFEQARDQDNARYGGTGLGLTICSRLLKLMNGKIEIADNPFGQGTVFTITLPSTIEDRLRLLKDDDCYTGAAFTNPSVAERRVNPSPF